MFKIEVEKGSRCSWSTDEAKNLLAIMKKLKVMDLLNGKTRRNRNVYVLLSNELSKKGFNKSSEQVKLKFRTLKKEFFKTKQSNSKNTAGRKSMEHFQDLEELLGQCRVAAAVGQDTTIKQESPKVCENSQCESFDVDSDTDISEASELQQDIKRAKLIEIQPEKGSRCSWSTEETKNLLATMKELNVIDLLDGKTRRNRNVYMLLSNELSKKGFNKSSEQVKLRFRTLKREFFKTKRNINKNSAGSKSMEHFQELEELLGHQRVAAAVGQETFIKEDSINICEDNQFDPLALMNEADMSESVESEPLQNIKKRPKKKKNALQMTLRDIAADVKESHQLMIEMMREENNTFLTQQRHLHEDFLKETREIMAEDRKETKEMLLDILNRFR